MAVLLIKSTGFFSAASGNWLLVRTLLPQTNWIITPKVASMSRPHLPDFCLFIVVAVVVLVGPHKR